VPSQRRVAEVIALAACGQHEIVVWDLAPVSQQPAPVEVGADHLSLLEIDVRERLDQRANRSRYLARIEQGRRHLVEQGREQVVVVAVDDQHIDWRMTERPGTGEAAKSRAGDHDPWTGHVSGGLRNRPPVL